MLCCSFAQLYCVMNRSVLLVLASGRSATSVALTIVYGECCVCLSNPLSRLCTNLMAVCNVSQSITAVLLFNMVYIGVCGLRAEYHLQLRFIIACVHPFQSQIPAVETFDHLFVLDYVVHSLIIWVLLLLRN